MNSMKPILNFLVIFFLICSISLYCQVEKRSANGIYMSVCGKAINIEDGKGIARLEIDLVDFSQGYSISGISNKKGNFRIKMVPPGLYKIDTVILYMTCPENLIIDSMPDEIKVSLGKNITEIEIYLKNGASISGRVLGADAITPLKGALISRDTWIDGKIDHVYTDGDGRFKITGVEEGEKMVFVKMNGYALEGKTVKIQNGQAVEMEDFILGLGKVSVKGQILSAPNNQAIENATIFFLYDPQYENFYSGNDVSSSNGTYKIIGLKEPGIFDVTILHKNHQVLRTKVNLTLGENNFDFNLEPKKESVK